MFTIQRIVTMLGGEVILLTAVGFLIKIFLNHNLTKDADNFRADLQSRADEFRIQLQSNASVQIEKLRATLQQTAIEHQIRFSKLHENRAEFIRDLYQRLVRARGDAAKFVFGDTRNNDLAIETNERMLELYRYHSRQPNLLAGSSMRTGRQVRN